MRSIQAHSPKPLPNLRAENDSAGAAKRRLTALLFAIFLGFALTSCGGGAAPKLGPISAAENRTAIDENQSLSLSVAIESGASSSVSWTITSGGGTLGVPSTSMANGMETSTVQYTAGAPGKVVITATLGDPSSQQFNLTVTAPPAIAPNQSLPAATEGTSYSQSLTSLAGGTGAGALTWSLAAGSTLPTGLTLNGAAGTITSGASGPSGPAGTYQFSLEFSDSGSPALTSSPQQVSLTINNYPAPTLSPATGAVLPAGTVGMSYSQQITVSNGNGPYTFSVSSVAGSAFPGGLSSSSSGDTLTVSANPLTAPACPNPTPCMFSVKVIDSSNPPQNATNTYSLPVNAQTQAAACVLSGKQSGFELTGADSTGFAVMIGSVTVAEDGSIGAGTFDFRNQTTLQQNQTITGGPGSCVNGTVANAGSITFTAAGVTRTFNFAMRADATRGLVRESDASGFSASGEIQLQDDPTASLQGSHAFGLQGGNTSEYFAVIGASCTDAQNNISFLEADFDVNGTMVPMVMGAASPGTLSAPDSNGRVTTTSPITYADGTTVDDTFYLVDGSKAFVITTGGTYPNGNSSSPNPPEAGFVTGVSGSVCLPNGQGGAFTNSSIGNSVFTAHGPYSPSSGVIEDAAYISVLYNFNPTAGTVTVTGDEARGGSSTESNTGTTANYSIASSGRGSVTGNNNAGQSSTSWFYLDGNGNAYAIVGDPKGAGVGFGIAEPQTATTIGSGTFAFGTELVIPATTAGFAPYPVTEVAITGTTFTDLATNGSSTVGSYSLDTTTGRGTITLDNANTFGDTSLVFYVYGNSDSGTSSNKIVILQQTATNPETGLLEQ